MTAQELLDKHEVLKPEGGFFVGDGWLSIIDAAFAAMVAAGWDRDLFQIKQKLGSLRIYIRRGNPVVHKIIDMAEQLAKTICERCGRAGKIRNGAWLMVLCDECAEKKDGS